MRRPIEVNTRDIYNDYRRKYKKDELFKPVDYQTYKKILYQFGENFIKEVINNREGVDFPNNKGSLRITKKKTYTGLHPKFPEMRMPYFHKDWITSRQENGLIPSYNDHSDGYKFKWSWEKLGSQLKHQAIISLDIIRRWDRYLAKHIKAGNQDYYDYTRRLKQ